MVGKGRVTYCFTKILQNSSHFELPELAVFGIVNCGGFVVDWRIDWG
jgi:hypothetical protein